MKGSIQVGVFQHIRWLEQDLKGPMDRPVSIQGAALLPKGSNVGRMVRKPTLTRRAQRRKPSI